MAQLGAIKTMFHNDAKVLDRLDRIENSHESTKKIVTEILDLLKSIHGPGLHKQVNGERKKSDLAPICCASDLAANSESDRESCRLCAPNAYIPVNLKLNNPVQ